MNANVYLAFVAGLASFLSPCVLPLVPAYLAYLGGQMTRPATVQAPVRVPAQVAASAHAEGSGGVAVAVAEAPPQPGRFDLALSGLAFVIGISIVFITFFYALRGTLAPVRNSQWLPIVSGAFVIVLAAQTAGIIRIPWLMRTVKVSNTAPRRSGMLGGLLLGLSFSAGWTPCIGATLGAVLSSAINDGTTAKGLLLVSAYCIGLGIPFLGLAAGIGNAGPLVRTLNQHRRAIDLVSATILLAMGILVLTSNMTWLSNFFSTHLPDWLTSFSTR
ncbi:MAG: cytochrome c biosis protein transrane region [Frankiales bacterium]|nr:cytochrome c biosis protein transrane region [Frankiales bacterium]